MRIYPQKTHILRFFSKCPKANARRRKSMFFGGQPDFPAAFRRGKWRKKPQPKRKAAA
jgi:hypothetical protein